MQAAARGIQSVITGGRLLAVMAEAGRPLMLRDVAAGADMTPGQAHAYLVSFREIGLVEQVSGSGLYQLGPFALQLGLARMRGMQALRLASDAVPDLAIESGLMVTVSVWGAFGATIVHVEEAVDQLHVNLRAGAVYSLRGTATGRVFAAFLPEQVVKRHLSVERRGQADSRRIGGAARQDGAEDAARTRAMGYATAAGSPIPGINAISAPVFDHTGQLQLAITLIGLAEETDILPGSPHTERVARFASALSEQLGYQSSADRQLPGRKQRA